MSPDRQSQGSSELWRDIVHVMLEDISRIDSFIGSLDTEAFSRDQKCVFAVCYAYVRLGEAVGKLPESLKRLHPDLP